MADFLCGHGVKRAVTCWKCTEHVRSQDPGLELDDGDITLRIKSRCPEWWIWKMLPNIVVETSETITRAEDVVMIPRSKDIIPSIVGAAITPEFSMGVVIDSEPCFMRTCKVYVSEFPADLYFKFSDERAIGLYGIFVDGKVVRMETTVFTQTKVTVEKPGNVVFSTTDDLLKTNCYGYVTVWT